METTIIAPFHVADIIFLTSYIIILIALILIFMKLNVSE